MSRAIPSRRNSNRLPGYDYSEPGAYFITLVAHQRECLFGSIQAGNMILSPAGNLIKDEWLRIPTRFTSVRLDEYTVMPNHFHAIVWIDEPGAFDASGRGEASGEPQFIEYPDASLALPDIGLTGQRDPSRPGSSQLGTIVGAFKSTTTRLINTLRASPGAPVWQRNFFDRVIRTEVELENIAEYVRCNPLNWGSDPEQTGG